jgi:uncharacterized protein YlaI
MMQTCEVYYCDNCGKRLAGFTNKLDIVTSKSEAELGWDRLHVKIDRHYGQHNDGERKGADLCKDCAVRLLQDALARVAQGERASVGVESPRMETWEDSQ